MQQALEEEFVLKIRIKFAKQGQMKFIGHLDIMRYFQKAIRRADIDISYSEGFSPHQKMSFASPLGVGLLSRGEYFDIEVNSTKSTKEAIEAFNGTMVEGMEVTGYRLLGDSAKNCMAAIAAADYLVHFVDECKAINDTVIENFMSQKEITVIKKTKKSEKEVDIRPLIYSMNMTNEGLLMQVASGSVNNLKPELVMTALWDFLKLEMPKVVYERMEMYADIGDENTMKLVTLESLGDIIE